MGWSWGEAYARGRDALCVLLDGEADAGLAVRERGDHFEVQTVARGGAADRAGIEAGMWVLAYGLHPCGEFEGERLVAPRYLSKWGDATLGELDALRPGHVFCVRVFHPAGFSDRFVDRCSLISRINSTPWMRARELSRLLLEYDQAQSPEGPQEKSGAPRLPRENEMTHRTSEQRRFEIENSQEEERGGVRVKQEVIDLDGAREDTKYRSSSSTQPEDAFNIRDLESEQRKAKKKRKRVSQPAASLEATGEPNRRRLSVNISSITGELNPQNPSSTAQVTPHSVTPHIVTPHSVTPPSRLRSGPYQLAMETPRRPTLLPRTATFIRSQSEQFAPRSRPFIPNEFVASSNGIDKSTCEVSFIQLIPNAHASEQAVCTTSGLATPAMIRRIGKRALQFDDVSFLMKKISQGVSFMDLRVLYAPFFFQLSSHDWHNFVGNARPVVCIPILDNEWWGLVTVIFTQQRVVVLYLDCRMPDESLLIRSKIHQHFINAYTLPPGAPSATSKARVTLELISHHQFPEQISAADSGVYVVSHFAAMVHKIMCADNISDIESLVTSVTCSRIFTRQQLADEVRHAWSDSMESRACWATYTANMWRPCLRLNLRAASVDPTSTKRLTDQVNAMIPVIDFFKPQMLHWLHPWEIASIDDPLGDVAVSLTPEEATVWGHFCG